MIFLYLKNASILTVFLKNAKIERFSYKLFRLSIHSGPSNLTTLAEKNELLHLIWVTPFIF